MGCCKGNKTTGHHANESAKGFDDGVAEFALLAKIFDEEECNAHGDDDYGHKLGDKHE